MLLLLSKGRGLTSSLRLRFAVAPAKTAGKKKVDAPAGAGESTEKGAGGLSGFNIYKTGSDPVMKPDSAYPAWLWKLAEAPLSLRQLRRMEAEEMTPEQIQRLVRLESRTKIKANNADASVKK